MCAYGIGGRHKRRSTKIAGKRKLTAEEEGDGKPTWPETRVIMHGDG